MRLEHSYTIGEFFCRFLKALRWGISLLSLEGIRLDHIHPSLSRGLCSLLLPQSTNYIIHEVIPYQ